MPSPADYVVKFCKAHHLGTIFAEKTLRVLAKMVTRGVRENDNARLAAIALHLHAIGSGQHGLTDAIARMAQVTPAVLMDLAKGARVKMGFQAGDG